MYYQTNQYQNQNQANYLQNQAIPVTNNSPQVIAQNQQYQYPGYAQQNQIATQPQYQKVQAAQNAKNVQQVQNAPNYQNVQQVHHQRQQPLTNNQNIQYYQVPGKPNNYVQYAQPGQQVYPQQVQQIPQVQQGQNIKYNYNIKTNVPDGKQQIRGQGQLLPNQNVNQIKQDPNLIQNIQVANQMGQPQQQKMMFRGPAPKNKHLTGSHKPSTKAPTLDPILAQQQPNTHIINNPNQQINNQNYINQTVNPNAHIHQNQKKVEPKMQIPGQEQKLDKANKKPSLMTVNSLAGLPYENYPQVEFSSKPFLHISGYGCNSYNGKVKTYNEDKIKIQYKVSKNFVLNNKEYQALISYFGVFDGHGGDKCSQFLKENLDRILFNQTMFPNNVIESIREAFKSAESKFRSIAVQNNKLIDKSGSCALIALIINDILYAINLGDSRGLYSRDGGKEFYQITRDHKPNDPKEKARIEKAGGQVYYANKVNVNGKEVILKEEQFGPGFKFPYRLYPSGLAVVRTIGDYYSKESIFKGKEGTNIPMPCVNFIKIDEKSDFILLGCDGIYDRLDNEKILNKIWSLKKKGTPINDIHKLCATITDAIIKFSMKKDSVDNVSVIFIAFNNFENKMKDPDFEYHYQTKCQDYQENIDLSEM